MADPTNKLTVDTLGHSGVIIDLNTLEPTLPIDALKSAQNATHDPTQGYFGALRKRPGLKRFNAAYAGGIILGGIPMAVVGMGGAPASGGGGDTGSAAGAGDGSGAPGAGGSGGGPAVSPAGAGSFGGGGLFSGARLIIIGRSNNAASNTVGIGWYVTSKGLVDVANLVTTPGPPEVLNAYPPTALYAVAYGTPYAFVPSTGYLYYAVAHDQVSGVGGAALTIRKANGATDVVAAVLPVPGAIPAAWNATGTTVRAAITTMHLGTDGFIYIGQKLKADGQNTAGNAGRILKMDPSTGAVTVVNTNGAPTSDTSATYLTTIPYALAQFQNSLYWGEFNLTSSELKADTVTHMSATTSDQKYSVDDGGFSQGEACTWMYPFPQTAPASNPGMDVQANRVLFAGLATNKATPAYAYVLMRKRGAVGQATKWTAVKQGSGAAAVNANHMVSAVAFNDKLYVAFYNPTDTARIFEFTPIYTNLDTDGAWDGSGTWATVFTSGSVTDRVPYRLYADQTFIYAIGTLGQGAQAHHMVSTDGQSWTDKTSSLPATSQAFPIPLFFAVDQ